MSEQKPAHASLGRILILMALGTVLIGVSVSSVLPTKLVWNASPSVPIGLYVISNVAPTYGNIVFVQLSKWAQNIADQRGYLPSNVPALKRIFALSDDRVCRFDRSIFINKVKVATARLIDKQLRNMPHWYGCRTLLKDEVFLLADHPDSFDGRYFGVTKMNEIIGMAHPIWTDEQ